MKHWARLFLGCSILLVGCSNRDVCTIVANEHTISLPMRMSTVLDKIEYRPYAGFKYYSQVYFVFDDLSSSLGDDNMKLEGYRDWEAVCAVFPTTIFKEITANGVVIEICSFNCDLKIINKNLYVISRAKYIAVVYGDIDRAPEFSAFCDRLYQK